MLANVWVDTGIAVVVKSFMRNVSGWVFYIQNLSCYIKFYDKSGEYSE
jgi:hypothetical protein